MADLQSDACAGECPSCPVASEEGPGSWRAAHDAAAATSPRGGSLLARAAAAFIVPVAGALTGAVLAGGGEMRRFTGMLAGGLIATILAVVGTRVIGRRHRAD